MEDLHHLVQVVLVLEVVDHLQVEHIQVKVVEAHLMEQDTQVQQVVEVLIAVQVHRVLEDLVVDLVEVVQPQLVQ